MENNKAFTAQLGNIRPIEGADKIVQASVVLNGVPITNVVVGADTKEGDRIVYFDANLCLNPLTILKDNEELARYLGKNGRVKTVKLRGVYSDGLCVPLGFFTRYDKKALEWEEGFSFTEINGKEICKKYEPPVRIQSQGTGKKKRKGKTESRMIEGQFHFHIDTDQLARNIHRISPDDVISISRKTHGSSFIVSRCLVKRKLSFGEKIFKAIGAKINDTEYDYVFASRRVVKNGELKVQSFYSTNIWADAGQPLVGKLAQGETVYGEILGYQSTGQWIQKNYDYGCKPGEHKIQVYRITKTSPDGHVTEYGWQAMKDRCKELGVEHVTEFYFGQAKHLFDLPTSEHWHENFLQTLRDTYLEKTVEENLVKKVPDEGIVLRRESGTIDVFKLKSLTFLKHETDAHEAGDENVEDEG